MCAAEWSNCDQPTRSLQMSKKPQPESADKSRQTCEEITLIWVVGCKKPTRTMWQMSNRENTAHSGELPHRDIRGSTRLFCFATEGFLAAVKLEQEEWSTGRANWQTAEADYRAQNKWGCSKHAVTKTQVKPLRSSTRSWLWLKQLETLFFSLWGNTFWFSQCHQAEGQLAELSRLQRWLWGREQQPPQGWHTPAHTPWHNWVNHEILMMQDCLF